MTNVAAAFETSKQSIAWAYDAIDEFEASAAAFFEGKPAEMIAKVDAKTGEKINIVRLKSRLPSVLARKATEAVTTLKHAFDQSAFAAKTITTGKPPGLTYFPWANDPTDLDGRLRKSFDQRLWDIFRFHEPYPRSDAYPGGDDIIRSLASLANQKHTVGIVVMSDFVRMEFPTFVFHPGSKTGSTITIPDPRTEKHDGELARWSGGDETHGDYKVSFQVGLKNPRLPKPVEASSALRAFAAKAKAVAEGLQARCESLHP